MFDTHQAFMLLSVCIPQEQEENDYILELGEIETGPGMTFTHFQNDLQ